MPAVNPRITITLRPELHAILKRLSALTGTSQSALVGELLETSQPVFERMASMLEAAERLKAEGLKAPQEIRESLGNAQEKLEAQLGLALEAMEEGGRPLLEHAEKVARRSGGTRSPTRQGGAQRAEGEGSTPVPVTRGSGTPRAARKGEEKGTERRVRRGSV